jgi:uncharacterized membrane protein
VVNSIVAGAGTALVLASIADAAQSITVGVIVAVVLAVLHGMYQERRYAQVRRSVRADEGELQS